MYEMWDLVFFRKKESETKPRWSIFETRTSPRIRGDTITIRFIILRFCSFFYYFFFVSLLLLCLSLRSSFIISSPPSYIRSTPWMTVSQVFRIVQFPLLFLIRLSLCFASIVVILLLLSSTLVYDRNIIVLTLSIKAYKS